MPKKNKYELERVQRRAARFVSGRYHNTSSVSDIIGNLNWETLEQRRMRVRVTMFYKITNNVVAIDLNQYVTHQQKITRFTNKLQFQTYSTTKDYFKCSSFPQTIRIWNSLPASIIVPSQSLDQFKTPRLQILNPTSVQCIYMLYLRSDGPTAL